MLLGGAGIQYPEQYALRLANTDRFCGAQEPAINRENLVFDVEGALVCETWFPLVQKYRDFEVIAPRLVAFLDDQHAELAAVGPGLQIPSRRNMAVIPTRASRPGGKRIPAVAVARNVRRAFLMRAVHVRWNVKAMPVDEVVIIRL